MARKKSLNDIRKQHGNLMRSIIKEIRNTEYGSDRYKQLQKRYSKVQAIEERYDDNINNSRSYKRNRNNERKYSQFTYMGLSNG